MNKTLGYVVGVVAVVAFVVSVVAFNDTPTVVKGTSGSQGVRGEQGPVGPRGLQGPAGSPGRDAPVRLGAVSGPDVYFPYTGVNNVRTWVVKSNFIQGSTTVCSLKGPSATTTVTAAARFTLASTTAIAVDFAVAAQPAAATTTLIAASRTVAASAQETIVASTTGPLAPNTYVNLKMDNGLSLTGTKNTPTGMGCQAVFTEI